MSMTIIMKSDLWLGYRMLILDNIYDTAARRKEKGNGYFMKKILKMLRLWATTHFTNCRCESVMSTDIKYPNVWSYLYSSLAVVI